MLLPLGASIGNASYSVIPSVDGGGGILLEQRVGGGPGATPPPLPPIPSTYNNCWKMTCSAHRNVILSLTPRLGWLILRHRDREEDFAKFGNVNTLLRTILGTTAKPCNDRNALFNIRFEKGLLYQVPKRRRGRKPWTYALFPAPGGGGGAARLRVYARV